MFGETKNAKWYVLTTGPLTVLASLPFIDNHPTGVDQNFRNWNVSRHVRINKNMFQNLGLTLSNIFSLYQFVFHLFKSGVGRITCFTDVHFDTPSYPMIRWIVSNRIYTQLPSTQHHLDHNSAVVTLDFSCTVPFSGNPFWFLCKAGTLDTSVDNSVLLQQATQQSLSNVSVPVKRVLILL